MKVKDHFLTAEEFTLRPTEIPGILKTEPVPANLEKYYESKNYISHHQDSNSLKEKIYKQAQSFNLNYKRNLLAKRLPKGANVLDYGCGAGEFLRYCEEDFHTFGYEPNKDAREAAAHKTKTTELIPSLSDLEDGKLNAITLWHVLEHIENQENILNAFHKKLNDKGLLYIAVPNYNSYDAQYYKENWAAYDVPRHIYHFSRSGMQKYLNNHQWRIVEIKPLLLDSFYISLMSEKYRKNPLFWLIGPYIGAISNIKAAKTGEFSSLIYVVQKK